MKLITVSVAASASLLGACAISDFEDEDVSITEQYGKPQCDEWGCGMNSPYIDNWGFHSLRLDGALGEKGFQIWKFEKNGVEYDLHVEGGKMFGTKSGYLPLVAFGAAGPGLVGAKIHLLQNGVPSWEILIADAGRVLSWANQNGQQLLIETYELKWAWPGLPNEKFQNLCSGSSTEGGMTAYHAVVFEGDVIDSDAKKVSASLDNNQFNIGCAGNTLAKMALMAHTAPASNLGFVTSTSERQTLLKMYSADYCGTGKAFTVGGQPLRYSDDQNWINAAFPSRVEALWDRNGALCLNTPRTLADPIPASQQYFTDVETQIAAACNSHNRVHPTRPPACPSGTSTTNPSPNHLVSANKSFIVVPFP